MIQPALSIYRRQIGLPAGNFRTFVVLFFLIYCLIGHEITPDWFDRTSGPCGVTLAVSNCCYADSRGSQPAATSVKMPKLPWAPPLIPAGNWPVHVAVDPATNTIYVANNLDTIISVIDGKNCSAGHSSKCTPIATIVP
jgi:DNA-binding beta-propeller fold protein YncE